MLLWREGAEDLHSFKTMGWLSLEHISPRMSACKQDCPISSPWSSREEGIYNNASCFNLWKPWATANDQQQPCLSERFEFTLDLSVQMIPTVWKDLISYHLITGPLLYVVSLYNWSTFPFLNIPLDTATIMYGMHADKNYSRWESQRNCSWRW